MGGKHKRHQEEAEEEKQRQRERQQQQEQQRAKNNWQHMVAGALAGSSAVLLLHPFDVIKTRLQVQDGVQGALPAYRSATHAVSTIFRQEGWKAFYSGLSPALIGSGLSWGAYLYLYERVKSWHRGWQGSERLNAGWNLLSAAQAGAMVCLMTNPIWLVKTRMALQRRAAAPGIEPYRGLVDALVRIGREEGVRGYYKGIGPSLVLQTTHGAIQFAVYEELKQVAASTRWGWREGWQRLWTGDGGGGGDGQRCPPQQRRREQQQQQQQEQPPRQLSPGEVSVYGALSKLTAAVSTYPTQVVRSRLQQRFEAGRALVYNSTREAVVLTWQREGFGGFYKGLAPSLLRVMPQSAITLVVYEGLLQWLAAAEREREAEGQPPQPSPAVAGRRDEGALQLAAGERRREGQHRPRVGASLTDKMQPLVIAADSQAEQ